MGHVVAGMGRHKVHVFSDLQRSVANAGHPSVEMISIDSYRFILIRTCKTQMRFPTPRRGLFAFCGIDFAVLDTQFLAHFDSKLRRYALWRSRAMRQLAHAETA
jgi:hypothetical protein